MIVFPHIDFTHIHLNAQLIIELSILGTSIFNWLTTRKNKSAIQRIHVDMNSRFTQWMLEHGEAEKAKGELAGIAKATLATASAVVATTEVIKTEEPIVVLTEPKV